MVEHPTENESHRKKAVRLGVPRAPTAKPFRIVDSAIQKIGTMVHAPEGRFAAMGWIFPYGTMLGSLAYKGTHRDLQS